MSKYAKLIHCDSLNLTAFQSFLIIILLIASILCGLAVCRPLPDSSGKKQRDADLKYYQTVVEQIHAGQSYYTVAGYELRRMGYATASIFNWRLPALSWFLGKLPSIRSGQIIAFILALTTLLIWMMVFHQNNYARWQIFLGGFIMSSPAIYSLTFGPSLFHEYWAGMLIALSLAAYARGWSYTSVAAGLAALFLRELSLPFVCLMMFLAYMEGKRKEAFIWFLGILCFGGEMLIHWSIVSKLITESDKALPGGWIVFGGWPFVLNTAQMHPFLILSPPWVAAVLLPLALLGLAGLRGAAGLRISGTVGIYIMAFAIAGRQCNSYWGLMYNFVMPLGFLYLPFVLKKLWQPFEHYFNRTR